MALKIVYGSSGIGKSYKLYKDVITAALEDDKISYQIIVPEQFTMETQKIIVNMHPGKGVMNIDASSFVRLAHKVFDELGIRLNRQLDDLGKDIIIRQLVEKNKDKLHILSKNIDKMGYIEEIKSLISELLQYDISADGLKNVIENVKNYDTLSVKLKDVLLVYKEFISYIDGRYIAMEEVLEILSANVKESDYIKNTVFVLDGFTGFTPVQFKLIEELLKYSKEVIVTFTIDATERINVISGKEELFYLPKDNLLKLYDIAERNQIEIKKPLVMSGPNYRFKDSNELAFLEANIFRNNVKPYTEAVDNINIYECSNPKEEIEKAIYEIRKLIVKEKYRYREIAVVTGNMDNYGEMIYKLFEQNGIPAFLDNKKNILSNPAVEGIMSLLDICLNDFDYAAVFTYLKSGISNLEQDNIDELENYVLAYGIRGKKRWSGVWQRKNKRLSSRESYIDDINMWREAFLNEILEFNDGLKKCKTAKDYSVLLYNYMVSMDIQKKLELMRIKFETDNQKALAKEYSQIFGKIVEVLDKIVEFMGDDKLSFKEFGQILKIGLKEVKVGIIPPTIDVVTIGDVERTRLKDIKALFLVGVNDGVIPVKLSGGSILSTKERQILEDNNFKIKPLLSENVFVQRYYLYLNLTKPSHKLYLSYSRSGFDGKEIRKSYIIDNIIKIYKKLNITCVGSDDGYDDYIVIPKAKLYKDGFADNIGADTARLLYGSILLGSISRMEKYSKCQFQYFLEYGLKINERMIYELDDADIGNLFHGAIEKVHRMINTSSYEYTNLPDDVRREYVENAVKAMVVSKDDDIYSEDARNEFIVEKTIEILDKTVWSISKQLQLGQFVPIEFEREFETETFALSNGAMLRLKGVIDRIDAYEDDENIYIRIIDYKTSDNELKPKEIYNGLQLQLLTYLSAAMDFKWNKKAIPAAAMYYNIKDPIIDKIYDNDDGTKIENAILKECRMQGYVNSDERVKTYMDPEYETFAVKRKPNVNVISEKLIRDLGQFVIDKIVDYGDKIMNGDIAINPYKESDYSNSCGYCAYKEVCKFMPPADSYRKLEDVNVLEYLKGEKDNGGKVDTGTN